MKLTLLEMTQTILNKMSSDEVNSIGDTTESMQVANEIKTTFYNMWGNIEQPYQYNLVALEPSVDILRPTHMKVPENVDNFKWIKYNTGTAAEPAYQFVEYRTPEEFLYNIGHYTDNSYAQTVQDYSGSYIVIQNNSHPSYFTMFDDEYIVFNSYDADVDDTLQASKVQAFAQTIPSWTMEDSFVPNLPAKHFPQLVAEAAAACSAYFKQVASPIDQQRARQQYVRHFNNRNRQLKADDMVLDFGRS